MPPGLPSGGLPATCVVGLIDVGCHATAAAVADAARAALTAASAALPARGRVGIATVSTQLTLFDCRPRRGGAAPTARAVSLLDGDDGTGPPAPLELGDALPAPSFLAALPRGEAGVRTALDAVCADAAAGGGGGGCAAGAAVQALLAYLVAGAAEVAADDAGAASDEEGGGGAGPAPLPPPSAPAPPLLLGTRLILFLGGPPTAGRGAVTDSFDASSFWSGAGAAAAALGVVVDVFLLDGVGRGAAALAPLAAATGGELRAFTPDGLAGDVSGVDDTRLAGLVRSLVSPSRPAALAGTVRLRVPPSLAVARAYVGMACLPPPSSSSQPDTAALPCARVDTSIAFDLEYAPGRRGRLPTSTPLVAQAAFQYWCLEAAPDPASPAPFRARRRLRIVTNVSPFTSTPDPAAVHGACAPAPILALLAHKAARAAAAEGGASARGLLRDWLVLLTSARAHVDGPADPETAADARLRCGGGEDGLRALPRLVWGLLQSPLLGTGPDAAALAGAALSWLPPLDLARALYPELTAWEGVETVVRAPAVEEEEGGDGVGLLGGGAQAADDDQPPLLLPLTAAALACGPPLFLLDAHDALVVANVGAEGGTFPPPRGSGLREAVEAARAGRTGRAPALSFVSGGADAAAPALAPYLVDDMAEEEGAPPAPGGGGLAAFLAGVTEDARCLLREGAGV